jgi:hypothetical protein
MALQDDYRCRRQAHNHVYERSPNGRDKVGTRGVRHRYKRQSAKRPHQDFFRVPADGPRGKTVAELVEQYAEKQNRIPTQRPLQPVTTVGQ